MVVVLLGAIVAYVQLGPIRTVMGIQKSFRTGDMASLLDNSIDFEAVREEHEATDAFLYESTGFYSVRESSFANFVF